MSATLLNTILLSATPLNVKMVAKELNIKNRTYYFWNDLSNLKDFDPNLLKLNKKSSMDINIYYNGYVTKKPGYNINSVNLVYLLIGELDGYIEEKEGNKYLNIGLTDSHSEVLKNMQKFGAELKIKSKR